MNCTAKKKDFPRQRDTQTSRRLIAFLPAITGFSCSSCTPREQKRRDEAARRSDRLQAFARCEGASKTRRNSRSRVLEANDRAARYSVEAGMRRETLESLCP